MADMTPITYGTDAHTAERMDTPRQDESEHSRRFRLSAASGQRLPHRCPTVDLFPMRELQDMKPAKLREIEQMPGHTPRPTDRPEHPLRWDEECLRYTSQTKRNFIIGVIRALGMVGFFFALFIFPVSTILTYFASISQQSTFYFSEALPTIIKFYSLLFSVLLSMWGGANLLYRLFPNFAAGYQPGPMWELNRRTGMVTVFANPAKKSTAWQVAHRLPFHEFDCYLQSTPSHQGLPQFNLSLVHYRQEAYVALVGMFGASSTHEEQRAAWDMVQRYMDTSQPLPDTPLWEEFRPLDPTTREHDRRTGRPPRYWRDMDDETYQQQVRAHQEKLDAFYRR
ncbi:YihY/virulence factor BrkB family protein [Halomonas sp. 328]|uniref:hypothetical protein n=1 Tax=Halomonas sp. 328 TaxID=2776704 RepID=UPI0018A74820|nr:hypothetical protein [Halomonas sp. 328]MBF8221913.1 hypothetical protein [Halomonas sp. 328]